MSSLTTYVDVTHAYVDTFLAYMNTSCEMTHSRADIQYLTKKKQRRAPQPLIFTSRF